MSGKHIFFVQSTFHTNAELGYYWHELELGAMLLR
jgi:hypothetical protein